MKKFSAAVIGLGQIGLGYDLNAPESAIFSHSKALLKHPGFSLLGGTDPSPAARSAFETFTGCSSFPDMDSLLASAHPEVIIIATPTALHEKTVLQALAHKPKAILLEKPISISLDSASIITQEMHRLKIPIFVNYPRLYDPAIKHFIDSFRSGAHGKPMAGHIYYSKGLYNNASHFVSLAVSLLGEPEDVVYIKNYGKSPLIDDIDVDFAMRFKECSVSVQRVDELTYSIGEFDFLTSTSRFRLTDFSEKLEFSSVIPDPLFAKIKTLAASSYPHALGREQYQLHVINFIYEALSSQNSWEQGLESYSNALASLKICERVSSLLSS